jgi:ketosteroid isomerase-like protein
MKRGKVNRIAPQEHQLLVALLILLALGSAVRLNAMPHAERHESRHEIDRLEDQWRNALLTSNIPAMDALLADDYMAITSNGTLQSKDETLANMKAGKMHFKSLDLVDRKVRFYGSTALVTSRAEVSGTGPDGEIAGSFRYTRVYVKDTAGNWHIVSFEASRIRNLDAAK